MGSVLHGLASELSVKLTGLLSMSIGHPREPLTLTSPELYGILFWASPDTPTNFHILMYGRNC